MLTGFAGSWQSVLAMTNLTFARTTISELPNTPDKSEQYWRAQARDIFSRFAPVQFVEIVRSGNKLDSASLVRGQKHAPPSTYIVIASTGGRWGKSRRDFAPA